MLIASLAYGSHFFVFSHHMSKSQQIRYQFFVTMVWISYAVAILKLPGAPPQNYTPERGHWKRWCYKCKVQKPPRTHHCKSCNKCVLQMDHHCPWTLNCVGHGNLPHFLRFLVWTVFTATYTLVKLFQRAIAFYHDRNLPMYLTNKGEMVAVILLLPLVAFICLSVLILLIRCIIHVVTGTTQIEEWEKERIENQVSTQRFWDKVGDNYKLQHGRDLPKLESWIRPGSPMTADDIIFPYDHGFYKNSVNALGPPWKWLLPWAGPSSDGIHYEINYDEQLDLPWPPDGGFRSGGEPHVYRDGREWTNDMGETLQDYGVDMAAEAAN